MWKKKKKNCKEVYQLLQGNFKEKKGEKISPNLCIIIIVIILYLLWVWLAFFII